MNAEPLDEELINDIEKEIINPKQEPKQRAKLLTSKYNWDPNEAKKIWCFGPENNGPNLMVDCTKGVQYLNEIKDSVQTAFNWTTKEGVLCSEIVRGVGIKVLDVNLHSDAVHRGPGQILPSARKCILGSQLCASPKLLEPWFLVEIQVSENHLGGAYSCLTKRRAEIIAEISRPGTPLKLIRAYLPVMESFGFTEDLRSKTGGTAFPQCVFDHWKIMPGNPFSGMQKQKVTETRKRKGMPENIPELTEYKDKL